MKKEVAVIIVCAGFGKRLGRNNDKPVVALKGKPLFLCTLEKFLAFKQFRQIVLVLRREHISYAKKLISDKRVTFVQGGKERYNSVYNGLKTLNSDIEYVLIHDGGRPLVSKKVITTMIKELRSYPAVITAIAATDTVKLVKNNQVKQTLKREEIFLVQTPQGFKKELILKAYENIKPVYDDSQLLEAIGVPVKVILGDRWNIKITYPEDLVVAASLLSVFPPHKGEGIKSEASPQVEREKEIGL